MSDETKACPFCGETIQAQAVLCRFCKSSLGGAPAGGPAPSAPPAPPPRKSNVMTIVLVVVALVLVVPCVLGILAALLLPAIARATRLARETNCANNLSQLWKMEHVYSSQFGGREKLMSPRTGEDFWLHLSETNPPLIDSTTKDIYECPARDDHGRCDYRGPAQPVAELTEEAPVGADKTGNHSRGGGNVLRKNGAVVPLEPDDPAWRELDGLLKP